MDEPSKTVLKQYTLDAASILKQSILLMEGGQLSFYRVAAAQLRILLCDTTFRHDRVEDISILPILFPQMKLSPLQGSKNPGSVKALPLTDWLAQPAGQGLELTVRQMIRRICDVDGGAHVDPKPVNGIPAGTNQAEWILMISKLLLPELEKALGIQP